MDPNKFLNFKVFDFDIILFFFLTVDICVEVLTSVEHTLKDLKIMTLKNLEAIYKESFIAYDLDIFVFVFQEIEIEKQDEELSLGVMISKVFFYLFDLKIEIKIIKNKKNHLEETLVGNVFQINMKIKVKKIEMDIMKTIMLKNKEPNEKMRVMIKYEHTPNKLSKRILCVRVTECLIILIS